VHPGQFRSGVTERFKLNFMQAATEMTEVLTAVSGYWSSALVIAIGIVLFVIGRKVVKKI